MFIQVSPKITLHYEVGGDHFIFFGKYSHKAVNDILLFLLDRLYIDIYYHICDDDTIAFLAA